MTCGRLRIARESFILSYTTLSKLPLTETKQLFLVLELQQYMDTYVSEVRLSFVCLSEGPKINFVILYSVSFKDGSKFQSKQL